MEHLAAVQGELVQLSLRNGVKMTGVGCVLLVHPAPPPALRSRSEQSRYWREMNAVYEFRWQGMEGRQETH